MDEDIENNKKNSGEITGSDKDTSVNEEIENSNQENSNMNNNPNLNQFGDSNQNPRSNDQLNSQQPNPQQQYQQPNPQQQYQQHQHPNQQYNQQRNPNQNQQYKQRLTRQQYQQLSPEQKKQYNKQLDQQFRPSRKKRPKQKTKQQNVQTNQNKSNVDDTEIGKIFKKGVFGAKKLYERETKDFFEKSNEFLDDTIDNIENGEPVIQKQVKGIVDNNFNNETEDITNVNNKDNNQRPPSGVSNRNGNQRSPVGVNSRNGNQRSPVGVSNRNGNQRPSTNLKNQNSNATQIMNITIDDFSFLDDYLLDDEEIIKSYQFFKDAIVLTNHGIYKINIKKADSKIYGVLFYPRKTIQAIFFQTNDSSSQSIIKIGVNCIINNVKIPNKPIELMISDKQVTEAKQFVKLVKEHYLIS